MSQRFRARDLDAFDHDESDLVGPLLGDVERRVQIASRYERFPRADFDMVRDGDGVEAVFPCLVDAHGRPYAAVREDRVRVKVAFEHMETVDIPESGCRCARSLISISGSSKTSSLRI